MKERKEIKLGEYVVITETDPNFNYEVKHYGKLITIDTDRRYGSIEVIIKRSTIRCGEHKTAQFYFAPQNVDTISIRLMELDEMPTWTKICWYFRNVVFPLHHTTTFKPATFVKQPEEEKNSENVILA